MANAAASHVAEQDDVHNGSVFHPATVVFPGRAGGGAGLGASGQAAADRLRWPATRSASASASSWAARTTRCSTPPARPARWPPRRPCGNLLGLTPAQMQHAFGSAGTQSAGLWEFLRTAADSKQLHTAHAAAAGLMSAYLAQDGFTGAAQHPRRPAGHGRRHVQRRRPRQAHRRPGHALGHGRDLVQVPRLLPPHAPGGRCAAAGDAGTTSCKPATWRAWSTHVHQGAIDVLGPVIEPADRAPEQVLHGHGAGRWWRAAATPA